MLFVIFPTRFVKMLFFVIFFWLNRLGGYFISAYWPNFEWFQDKNSFHVHIWMAQFAENLNRNYSSSFSTNFFWLFFRFDKFGLILCRFRAAYCGFRWVKKFLCVCVCVLRMRGTQ